MALETYNMNNINKTKKQRNDDFNAVKSEQKTLNSEDL